MIVAKNNQSSAPQCIAMLKGAFAMGCKANLHQNNEKWSTEATTLGNFSPEQLSRLIVIVLFGAQLLSRLIVIVLDIRHIRVSGVSRS